MNEFGQGGEEETVEEKLANKPLTAPAKAAEAEVVTKVTGSDKSSAKKRR